MHPNHYFNRGVLQSPSINEEIEIRIETRYVVCDNTNYLLVWGRRNASVLAMELGLPCINQSIGENVFEKIDICKNLGNVQKYD